MNMRDCPALQLDKDQSEETVCSKKGYGYI